MTPDSRPPTEPATPTESIDLQGLQDRMGIEIRQIGIPPCPLAVLEVTREFAKSEPDFSHLARIIRADVSLSATLIKTTNSPYFGLNKRVRTVYEALLVLGLRLIVQTIAGLSLKKVFEHAPQMERFWDSSARMARVSGWIALRLGKRCGIRPEDAYTFGLFRDCGIPVLMVPFPDYREVLRQANDARQESFTSVEDRLMSLNHAVVGAQLAETWLLPGEIVHAIRHHHDLPVMRTAAAPAIPPASWMLAAVAQLAEHLIQLKTGQALTLEWDKAATVDLDQLGISAAELAKIEDECDAAVMATE